MTKKKNAVSIFISIVNCSDVLRLIKLLKSDCCLMFINKSVRSIPDIRVRALKVETAESPIYVFSVIPIQSVGNKVNYSFAFHYRFFLFCFAHVGNLINRLPFPHKISIVFLRLLIVTELVVLRNLPMSLTCVKMFVVAIVHVCLVKSFSVFFYGIQVNVIPHFLLHVLYRQKSCREIVSRLSRSSLHFVFGTKLINMKKNR